jgi:hypothetical protein
MLLVLALICPPAGALVSLNDGHDHIYVTGSVGYAWDSNVNANSDEQGDSSLTSTIVAEYTRRAGWIGVNGSITLEAARYNRLTSEDFNNPKFALELTKQTGRTTGSMTLSAARQSRADAAVNLRSTSWNYASGVNFRYPLAGIYTLSGNAGYALTKYVDAVFPDLATYTAGADVIRILSTERDLSFGYRYRRSETSVNSAYDDHSATVGLTGKLIRGVNGSIRGGYQVRVPHGFSTVTGPEPEFGSWTASGTATYAFSKRTTFTGTLAKDFSTTANTLSVDTLTAILDMQHAFSSHWTLSASVSGGDSRFLGDANRKVISLGPPLVLAPPRHDEFVSASLSMNYALNEHLKMAASYTWFRNWSNESYADFVRSGYNLNVSSRW